MSASETSFDFGMLFKILKQLGSDQLSAQHMADRMMRARFSSWEELFDAYAHARAPRPASGTQSRAQTKEDRRYAQMAYEIFDNPRWKPSDYERDFINDMMNRSFPFNEKQRAYLDRISARLKAQEKPKTSPSARAHAREDKMRRDHFRTI